MKRVIGVTGAIGSGKSTLSKLLVDHGGYLIDADAISKGALEIGTLPYTQTVNLFGEQILNPNLTINRDELRKIVVSSASLKKQLEAIIHPYVYDVIINLLNKQVVAKFFIIDAPLLFESNINQFCDWVIFVDCDPQVRYIRLRNRNTMSLNDAKSLEDSILPNDKKKVLSDFVVNNSYTVEFLHEQVVKILSKLALL